LFFTDFVFSGSHKRSFQRIGCHRFQPSYIKVLVRLADKPWLARIWLEHDAAVNQVPGKLAIQSAIGFTPVTVTGGHSLGEMDTEHRWRSGEGMRDAGGGE
jgi:hypothetical protein